VISFYISIFNIILYYWFSVRTFEANELEIYWPLALTISAIIVLHIYQARIAYRDLSKKNKSVEKNYAKAKLLLFESKSKPHRVLLVEKTNGNTRIKKFINDQVHPTLVQEPITESLTLIRWKTFCEYFGSHCYSVIILCLIFIILLAIVALHPIIPIIHRHIMRNETYIVVPWQIDCIRNSYIVISAIFYSLLIGMMTASIVNYLRILFILKRLLSRTELIRNIDLEEGYYLNLSDPDNLEYFLSLFRPVKRHIDPYHLFLSTMTCALIIEIILILTAIIHVFAYGHSTDLLTIWCLIDICILSLFIMAFLIVVVFINKLLTNDFIRHLKKLKKVMVQENLNANIHYLNAVIDHMESASREYAVKLLGFVVDQKLAIKFLISVLTGIGSSFVSFIKTQ
jgi:hypothetical protein